MAAHYFWLPLQKRSFIFLSWGTIPDLRKMYRRTAGDNFLPVLLFLLPLTGLAFCSLYAAAVCGRLCPAENELWKHQHKKSCYRFFLWLRTFYALYHFRHLCLWVWTQPRRDAALKNGKADKQISRAGKIPALFVLNRRKGLFDFACDRACCKPSFLTPAAHEKCAERSK